MFADDVTIVNNTNVCRKVLEKNGFKIIMSKSIESARLKTRREETEAIVMQDSEVAFLIKQKNPSVYDNCPRERREWIIWLEWLNVWREATGVSSHDKKKKSTPSKVEWEVL